MNVGIVNGYIGIGNYKMPNITKTEEVSLPINEPSKESVTQVPEEKKPLFTDVENLSIGFNKQDDFSYIGKDADIEQLDMQRAISDMQKDKLFHQYQFFVRSAILG